MQDVLSYLLAIQLCAKSVHYSVEGSDFYSDHLLADRIYKGLDAFRDDIYEVYYLGRGLRAPEILSHAAELMKTRAQDQVIGWGVLCDLVEDCLDKIQNMSASLFTVGENNLLGAIAEDLQKKLGFLRRRVRGLEIPVVS